MSKHTNTITLAKALRVIARDMESADGLPQMTILEAADRLNELNAALLRIRKLIKEYQQLGEGIKDARFAVDAIDQIAKEALNHEDK